MNLDKLLKVFVPTDHAFFPLFLADAENLVKAAEQLKNLVSKHTLEEREHINLEIKEIEHVGDSITTKTYEQLNKSFITPFDREDIHELTAHIDDVVDSINGIGRRIYMYRPKKLIPVYKEMAELIYQGAREIETAIHCLKDPVTNKLKITQACEKVKVI